MPESLDIQERYWRLERKIRHYRASFIHLEKRALIFRSSFNLVSDDLEKLIKDTNDSGYSMATEKLVRLKILSAKAAASPFDMVQWQNVQLYLERLNRIIPDILMTDLPFSAASAVNKKEIKPEKEVPARKSHSRRFLMLRNGRFNLIIEFRKLLWSGSMHKLPELLKRSGKKAKSIEMIPGFSDTMDYMLKGFWLINEKGKSITFSAEYREGIMVLPDTVVKRNLKFIERAESQLLPFLVIKGKRYYLLNT